MSFRGLLLYKQVAERLRQRQDPASRTRRGTSRSRARDPGPDGTTGNADDGGLVTFCDYDPAYQRRGVRADQPGQPRQRSRRHLQGVRADADQAPEQRLDGARVVPDDQEPRLDRPLGDAVEPERRVLPARRDLGLERQADGQLSRAVRHQRERAVQLPGRRAAAAHVSVPQRAERRRASRFRSRSSGRSAIPPSTW